MSYFIRNASNLKLKKLFLIHKRLLYPMQKIENVPSRSIDFSKDRESSIRGKPHIQKLQSANKRSDELLNYTIKGRV